MVWLHLNVHVENMRCYMRCFLCAATHLPVAEDRDKYSPIEEKSKHARSPTRGDLTCATAAITIQHGSHTNSSRLLLDRDVNSQCIVVGNLGVGRLEKKPDHPNSLHKKLATTKTTTDI